MPIAKLSLIRLLLLRTSRDAFRTTVQPRIRPEHKSLAKEELLTVEGIIDEIYPDGRFGVTLDNEIRIIAYTAGKMRRHRIRSIVGDRVHVEMTPYDLSKGRIVFREKIPGQPGGARRRTYRR
jgi:translation initiation factor IF-1